MLSELALIDWVALLIAIVLLGVAAVATYLSHASAGPSMFSSPGDSYGISSGIASPTDLRNSREPAHAMSSTLDQPLSGGEGRSGPPPVPAHARHAQPAHVDAESVVDTDQDAGEVVLPDAPPPPILVRSTPDAEVIDLRDDRSETVAERAERLRKRPVSELEARQEAKAGVPQLLFANATNKLSAGTETVEGFKQREPGFFDDPMGRHELRYWNGHAWTEYVKEDGDRFIDPL